MAILLKKGMLGHFFSVLIVACVPGALAAPFADKAALKAAVINCLTAVPSGENCCSSGGANCGAAGTDDMPLWDTSLVTDMDWLFCPATNCGNNGVTIDVTKFNQPIGDWNTSKVTRMNHMLQGNAAFNQPIGKWDTSHVTCSQVPPRSTNRSATGTPRRSRT